MTTDKPSYLAYRSSLNQAQYPPFSELLGKDENTERKNALKNEENWGSEWN